MSRYFAALLLLAFAGCGTSTVARTYGHRACFSEAHQGYILANREPSQALGADPLVLIDPVTGQKLRCQEQVIGWSRALAQTLPEEARDNNLQLVTVLPLFGAMVVAAAPIAAIAYAGRSVSWQALRAQGEAALEADRAAEAVALFERALLKGGQEARRHTTLLHQLAAAYAAQGNPRRARVTYYTFLTEALVSDGAAYADALRQLRLLGDREPEACFSQAPVSFSWGQGTAGRPLRAASNGRQEP